MITESSKKWRASVLGVLVIIVGLGLIKEVRAENPGKQIFNSSCVGCHTVGDGKRVGPDLAGIHEKRSQEWLEKFVKSSQSLIKSGDADAVAVFNKFNKIVMPDSTISSKQINEVLSYINSASAKSSEPVSQSSTQQTASETKATKEDIVLGQKLFQGKIRFKKNGPTCISCHDVKNDAVIGGGVLAKELTNVFSKMGGSGVRAILGQAPFPVMETAYKNKALTETEIFALVSFLQDADEHHAYKNPRDYGKGLLISGVIGAFILFGFYSLLWLRRRKDSVNQKIYDRQVKSI